VVLFNIVFFVKFSRNVEKMSVMILQDFVLLFGGLTIFVKVIEKQFLKKVQKNEKQKMLVEKKANSIRNLVSNALSDNEISESEFEKILFEIEKYRKKDEKLNLESDKIITNVVFSKKNSGKEYEKNYE